MSLADTRSLLRRALGGNVVSRSRSAALVLLACVLGSLAACHPDKPTELGPQTAPEPAPPPAIAASPATPSRITPAAIEAANAINGDGIRAVVAEIADDRYQGRAPGSAGDKMTRAYLAKQLSSSG